jgi:hypothetical protein
VAGEPLPSRQYFSSPVREYLERSPANVPIVLLFDDLHWPDDSTLLYLELLASSASAGMRSTVWCPNVTSADL